MSRYKVRSTIADYGTARMLAMALEELVEPAAEATALFEQGTGWLLEAYYAERPDVGALAMRLCALSERPVPVLELVEVPAENWVKISQDALPPVAAGRFTVHGSHDRARIPRGPHAILIDAGEAFGTAHHATTQGCLVAIDAITRVCRPPRRVLDLGCGSGVLAIALARRLPHARVLASDVDPISIEVAAANARANGVSRRVRFVVAEGFGDPGLAGCYDLIVANILAGPLIGLAAPMARAARPGGTLVLSGILEPQAAQVLAAYAAHGFSHVSHQRIAGWSTLTLVRRRQQPPRRAG